jgi:hypothetical protein
MRPRSNAIKKLFLKNDTTMQMKNHSLPYHAGIRTTH